MDEAERQIDGLKVLFSVENDLQLAAALGLERTTIAQWRRRSHVPKAYTKLIPQEVDRLERRVDAAKMRLREVMRNLVYRYPRNQYLVAAALASISETDLLTRAGETVEERGLRLEALLCDRFSSCRRVGVPLFARSMPEDEPAYQLLMAAMEETIEDTE